MSLCPPGHKVLHKILGIANDIEPIIDKALKLSSKLLEFTTVPGIDELLSLIPNEPHFQMILCSSVDALTKSENILLEQDPAKKLQLFLEDMQTSSEIKKHGDLIKFAQTIVRLMDGSRYPESYYDTIVQAKLVVQKAEVETPNVEN